MGKKLYTGAHLLEFKEGKRQFGSIGAHYNKTDNTEKVMISLRKEDLTNFSDVDGFISFEIDLEKLGTLANVTRSVHERIDVLKTLDKRDKLKPNAYSE